MLSMGRTGPLLCVLLSVVVECMTCPSECNCFGWNGELVADCSNRGLTTINLEFTENTTEIHLQYNNIETLDINTFRKVPNLRHLYLQANRITSLPNGIFDNLSQLETLRLNDNSIETLGVNQFSKLSSLVLLYAHKNKLQSLEENTFNGLPSIKQISVAGNPSLINIHRNTFNHNLTMIDVSGSALRSLEQALFSGNPNLEKLYLYNINTLVCDSSLEPFIRWMNFNPLTVFGRTTMVCAEPENLRGKSLAQVTSSNIVDPGSCPSECVCFTGIADCSSKGLGSLPEEFAPETTEIFLQNNNISQLQNNALVHLTKLEFLYYHENKLTTWDINVFTGPASTLKSLTLNNNLLSSLPVGVFRGMRSLQILNLNNNQIRRLRADDFTDLISLVDLSLAGNGISIVSSEAFMTLMSLKNLGLANNEISSLPDTLLDSSVQLYTMDISGNQFDYLPKIPQTVASVHARSGKLKVINESSLREAEMLEYLDVSGNTIYIIEENAFSGARNLQVLTMAGNTIAEVDDETFASLVATKLQSLDLSENRRLETISEEGFASVRGSLLALLLNGCNLATMSGKTLSGFDDSFYATLSNNPWNCDCKLQNLAQFINTKPEAVADEENAKCSEPKEEIGTQINQVNYEELCAEKIPTDDSLALVMSLSIVGAVVVFAAATFLIIWNSKQNVKQISDHESRSSTASSGKSEGTYVNKSYENTGSEKYENIGVAL